MSNEVDQTTGLPPLPEGQWWEVRECFTRHSIGYGYIDKQRDGYEVCLMTKRTIPASIEHGKHWWWTTPKRVPERTEDYARFRRQITDPAKYKAWGNGSSLSRVVGKTVIGPGDIIKAAKDIIDARDEQAEAAKRKAASDALIGAYPPKTLKATND